jgi:hypothetical protein
VTGPAVAVVLATGGKGFVAAADDGQEATGRGAGEGADEAASGGRASHGAGQLVESSVVHGIFPS